MEHLPLPGVSPGEYAAAREREGRVMAILRALGPRPEVVRAFLALADATLYGPATLGRRERDLLAVATSEANGAAYSIEVHAALLVEEMMRKVAVDVTSREDRGCGLRIVEGACANARARAVVG